MLLCKCAKYKCAKFRVPEMINNNKNTKQQSVTVKCGGGVVESDCWNYWNFVSFNYFSDVNSIFGVRIIMLFCVRINHYWRKEVKHQYNREVRLLIYVFMFFSVSHNDEKMTTAGNMVSWTNCTTTTTPHLLSVFVISWSPQQYIHDNLWHHSAFIDHVCLTFIKTWERLVSMTS